MTIYASIDTNVIVSAMITHNPESPALHVLEAALDGRIIYLYNESVIAELVEVIKRPKFNIPFEYASIVIRSLITSGTEVDVQSHNIAVIDPNDAVFCDIVLSADIYPDDTSYLITGNLKHFPKEPWIISPREMVELLC